MLIFDQLKKNDPHLRVLTLGVLLGMAVLLAGLWFVQVMSHRHYSENQKAQSFRTVRIPAIRGKILDRNGQPLAENQPSYNVSLYLDELREQFKEEWQRSQPPMTNAHHSFGVFGLKLFQWQKKVPAQKLTLNQRKIVAEQSRYRVVSKVVSEIGSALQEPISLDYGQFLKHYTNQPALPLLILTNLNSRQIARFQEQSAAVPGLDLEVQPNRVYPYHTSAAHVLGFLVQDNSSAVDEDAFYNFRLPDYRGVVGIEGTFDQDLRGRAGTKSVLVNSLGYRQSEYIWTAAEAGKNVVLTIDLDIQKAAETAMGKWRGAVVVMSPITGDILALVSTPAYDPNVYIPQITPEENRKLNDEELRPQVNRATQENYHPGSIFKIVVSLACLEAGLDPADKIINPPDPTDPGRGHFMLGRRKIKDTAPAGEYDFRRAFIRSSNTYFISNGLHYGVQKIAEIGERLHLGERTGIPTRQEVGGNCPRPQTLRKGWSPGETANLCIGQGAVDVTPLQMAVMISAIANGGNVLYPRLVQRIEPPGPLAEEATVLFPIKPPRDHLGVQPRTLRIIRDAMLADVEDKVEGTGKLAAMDGLRICSKTGTAQIKDAEGVLTDHTTWFASYAPYETSTEKPRYVVVVMVEGGASGGTTCAPIAKEIYKEILSREKYQKSKPPTIARTP